MPLTMPRSTAQMTGCSTAAPPKGQCSETMRSSLPCFSAWAAKPWAVSASATACRAVRKDRGPLLSAPRALGHGAAVLDADLLGQGLGLVGGQGLESAVPSSVDEHVVVADGDLEVHLVRGRPVALGRPSGAAAVRALDADLEVAAGGQLVEVVAGHVGVQVEALGHLGGGHAVGALVDVEEDLPAGRVTEGRGDGRDGRRELGGGQGTTSTTFHARYSTYARRRNSRVRCAGADRYRWPPPTTRSSRRCAPSRSPCSSAASSTSDWSTRSRSTGGGRSRSASPLTDRRTARCRDEIRQPVCTAAVTRSTASTTSRSTSA